MKTSKTVKRKTPTALYKLIYKALNTFTFQEQIAYLLINSMSAVCTTNLWSAGGNTTKVSEIFLTSEDFIAQSNSCYKLEMLH